MSKGSTPRSTNNHVLVVDDIETNLMFAEYLLHKVNPSGYVTSVLSALEAIDLLKKDPYAFTLILLDIEMPEIDGIEAAEKIREFNKDIAIVALTAHGDAEMLQRCLAAGMDGVASKPFREASIAKVVTSYNGKKSHYATQHYAQSDASKKSGWSRGFFVMDDQVEIVAKYVKSVGDTRFNPRDKSKSLFVKTVGVSQDTDVFVPMADCVKDVGAGASFIVMVMSDGKVIVHGGHSLPSALFPNGLDGKPTALPAPVTHVQAGARHVVAWSASTKHIFSWGCNVESMGSIEVCGQLGRSDAGREEAPGVIAIDGNVMEVACGDAHTLVLTDVGLFGFGQDSYSQLGGQNTNVVLVPKSIFVGNNVVTDVACGANHSVLITAQSSVLCWGLNDQGQCGMPPGSLVGRPTTVAHLTDIAQVSAGAAHCLALSRRGAVCSWGSNSCHQLGRRTSGGASHEPSAVQGSLSKTPVSIISCGHSFSMAVDASGNSWSWGCLQSSGATKHSKLPTQVKVRSQQSAANSLRVTKIRSGQYHSVALLSFLAADGDSESFDSSTEDYDNSFNEKSASRTLSAKVLQKVLRKKSSGQVRTPQRKNSFPSFASAGSSEDLDSSERRPLHRGSIRRSSGAARGASVASAQELTLIRMPESRDTQAVYESARVHSEARVLGSYGAYASKFLGQNHFLVLAKSPVGAKSAAVLRLPSRGKYTAVVFTKYGIFETQINQSLVLGQDHSKLASPRDLHIKLLTYFINYGYHDFDQKLAGYPQESYLQTREDEGEISWRVVSATKTPLPNMLLSLEARLGMTKRLTVGLICNIDGELTENAFDNVKNSGEDPEFKAFCQVLGAVVEKEDWRHFDGGLWAAHQMSRIFYTSWRGFEIVFHLAPVMTAELRKQYLARDKCLVVYTKASAPAAFEDSANSLAVVVQSLNEQESLKFCNKSKAGYRCGVYLKSEIWNFKSTGLSSSSLITSKNKLRNIILANIVNGCACVTSCLPEFQKEFKGEVESLVTEFFPQEAPV